MTDLEVFTLERMWVMGQALHHLVPFIYVAEPGHRRPERAGYGLIDTRVIQPADAAQWLVDRLKRPIRQFTMLNLRAGQTEAAHEAAA